MGEGSQRKRSSTLPIVSVPDPWSLVADRFLHGPHTDCTSSQFSLSCPRNCPWTTNSNPQALQATVPQPARKPLQSTLTSSIKPSLSSSKSAANSLPSSLATNSSAASPNASKNSSTINSSASCSGTSNLPASKPLSTSMPTKPSQNASTFRSSRVSPVMPLVSCGPSASTMSASIPAISNFPMEKTFAPN